MGKNLIVTVYVGVRLINTCPQKDHVKNVMIPVKNALGLIDLSVLSVKEFIS